MKSCQDSRKDLALLAVDALEIGRARELRAHVAVCAECRRYLAEFKDVMGALRAAEPEPSGQPSASFHRNVMAALTAAEPTSFGIWWNWQWALPAAVAVALTLAVWFVKAPRLDRPVTAPHPVAEASADLEPTFSNYASAANQSLDKLDELLKEQGEQHSSRGPVYTNSWLPPASLAD